MKHVSIVLGLVLLGITNSGVVLADTTPGGGFGQSQNLDAIKQHVEQRIQDAITKMQGRLTCVQNAQDRQSLQSCFPNRGQRRRGGNRWQRPGGQG